MAIPIRWRKSHAVPACTCPKKTSSRRGFRLVNMPRASCAQRICGLSSGGSRRCIIMVIANSLASDGVYRTRIFDKYFEGYVSTMLLLKGVPQHIQLRRLYYTAAASSSNASGTIKSTRTSASPAENSDVAMIEGNEQLLRAQILMSSAAATLWRAEEPCRLPAPQPHQTCRTPDICCPA